VQEVLVNNFWDQQENSNDDCVQGRINQTDSLEYEDIAQIDNQEIVVEVREEEEEFPVLCKKEE
jgi:hypothetical protein